MADNVLAEIIPNMLSRRTGALFAKFRVFDNFTHLCCCMVYVCLGTHLSQMVRILALIDRNQLITHRPPGVFIDQICCAAKISANHRLAEHHRFGDNQSQPLASMEGDNRIASADKSQRFFPRQRLLDQDNVRIITQQTAQCSAGIVCFFCIECLDDQSDFGLDLFSSECHPKGVDGCCGIFLAGREKSKAKKNRTPAIQTCCVKFRRFEIECRRHVNYRLTDFCKKRVPDIFCRCQTDFIECAQPTLGKMGTQ